MTNMCIVPFSVALIKMFYKIFQDATIERFREIIFERINPKLPKYFKNIPDRPVRYVHCLFHCQLLTKSNFRGLPEK